MFYYTEEFTYFYQNFSKTKLYINYQVSSMT